MTVSVGGEGRPEVPARLDWPVMGRREEDRAVAVVAEHRWSVALVGPPGIGKSVAATRIVDRVRRSDRDGRLSVVVLSPGPNEASMPFSAASASFGDFSDDARWDEHSAELQLREAASVVDRDLLIRVDDADRLDAMTARYVAWLVRQQHARLILSCRDFTSVPEPLRQLWVDDLLERIDVEALDVQDSGRLLEEALGGPLDSSSVERVHRATQGNPLYLREAVRAALASGALERNATGWFWRGRITASSSLADMYRMELAQLPDDLRDVVDIVALADPLPLSRLLGLVADADVDRVTALGLVSVDTEVSSDGTPVVRPSHPLIGEVIRSLVPVARRTRLFARANAFRADSDDSSPAAARLRATLWALECGIVPPIAQILDAAQIAANLQEYESSRALASAVLGREGITGAERVRALCIRSSAAAYDLGREAARADAAAAWELVQRIASSIDDALVVEAAELLANVLQFHDDDADGALALVDGAAPLVGDAARERLRLLRLAHLGWAGRFPEVLAETDRSGVLGGPVPESFLVLAPCAVVALAVAGRVPESLAFGREALVTASAHVESAPWSVGEIASVMHQVQMWAGLIDDLQTQVSVRRSSPFFKYDFTLELIGAGNHAIAQRRWEDARAAFSAAAERFAVMDHGGFAVYPWARLSVAHAMIGDHDAAVAALDRAMSTPKRGMRITAEEIDCTLAITEMILGRPNATDRAIAITERSVASGAWLPALFGCMMQIRFGEQAGRDVSRARELAERIAPMVQTPVGEAYAALLEGRRAGDSERIRAAEQALARAGFPQTLNSRVQLPLTKREYEVAELAAQGQSNRQIAEQLGLSIRTIDAHMSRVFAKWDLHARSELAARL
jgi:DNA-binding CsgD family transcriptional regulator